MRARIGRGIGAWEGSVRILTVVAAVTVLLLQGCGMSQRFHVRRQQVVASVNAQGQPGPSASQFSTEDTAAYCWFEYRNAPANKTLTCEIAYTDADGETETRDTTVALRPGNHKVHFGVEVERGQGLKAGSYEAQVYDGQTALFGTPLRFTVAEAAGTSSESGTTPLEAVPVEPTSPDPKPMESGGEASQATEPNGETVSSVKTAEANLNPLQ